MITAVARSTIRIGTDVSTARRVSRLRRHNRLRKRVSGTPERPRLVVKRSTRHIHVQVVDDTAGHTLVSASTMDASLRGAEGDKSCLVYVPFDIRYRNKPDCLKVK